MALTTWRIGAKRAGLLVTLMTVLATGSFAGDKIVWKQIPNAILQIDARAPKLWNLFQPGKKMDPLLLQIGSRYLVVYIRNKEIYELKPEQLERKGETLLWSEADKPANPIATSDWSTKDVGSAMRTLVKLASEGRTLDIQTPKMPDLRRGIY